MKELESVVIRFSGDSGDGMQLTGTQFSNTAAQMGSDIATFPDYPSEIRAPQGTIAGVSGFQAQFGSIEICTPGDSPDVLVALNPAALKANLKDVKKDGVLIVNIDAFDETSLKKAGYDSNPLEGDYLQDFKVIKADLKELTLLATKDIDLPAKSKSRCKNFTALGIAFYMFGHSFDGTIKWIENRFKDRPALRQANIAALKAGRNFAEALQIDFTRYMVKPAQIAPGKYRQLNGNIATAWGLIQAAEAAGLKLFLGSYPITPATDILHELSKYKEFGVKTFQAEDEIAGICSAIGASFGGALAATSTSGPGLALKGEALGLAVIFEIPLVIVNVQRGGPSTGLPTKTEQADLLQAFYGRNGECPLVIVAASRPSDCFHMAFEAARIALEHMTPVILLTDGYIGNGAEPWKIPDLSKEYNHIKTHLVNPNNPPDGMYMSYARTEDTLVRPWATPGMKGFEHRIGGLEKQNGTGNVSHNPLNHQVMVNLRAEKVQKVEDNIPLQQVQGDSTGDLLVLTWGGTYGAAYAAVNRARKKGKKVSLCHLRYLNPFPKNLEGILKSFSKVLIPELNMGQLKMIIDARFHMNALGLHKVQGLPFRIYEIEEEIYKILDQ